VLDQHPKFIAAQPRQQVTVAELLRHRMGCPHQGAISGRVTSLVVDLLEAIEVDHREPHNLLATPRDRGGQPPVPSPTVCQTCERIGLGQLHRFFVGSGRHGTGDPQSLDFAQQLAREH